MADKDCNKLSIQEWDINKFAINTITMLVGRRGTGKSTILQELCYSIRDKIDYCVGFSRTEEVNMGLSNIIPRTVVYGQMEIDKIQALMDAQKATWSKGRKGYHLLLVFDDCGYDSKNFRKQTIKDLFMNGRHIKITVIFTMQYCMGIPPELRTQVDYTFACRDMQVKNREKLRVNFFGQFQKFKEFALAFGTCTENFECMVSDSKTNQSNNIEDSTFWFKARLHLPKFRCGKKWWWKLNKHYYEEEELELPKLPQYRSAQQKTMGNITGICKRGVKGEKINNKK